MASDGRVWLLSPRLMPVALLLALAIAGTSEGWAQAGAGDEAPLHAGERIAEALAVTTGVPISPLVGVCGLGAYRWWSTPPAMRPSLPWYERPAFWLSGFALALLFAVNTTVGAALPGLKKPMDLVEHFENLASALLASPIVLLEVWRLVGHVVPAGGASGALPLANAGVAALGGVPAALSPLASFGAMAFALLAFVVVFLAFHTIQVLILLSPSTLLDLLLRSFRLGLLGVAGAAAAVDPWIGALFGSLLLASALLIAGWSFRWTVFGTVFAGDLLGGRSGTVDPARPVPAFATRGLDGVAPRTYGRVEAAGGGAWRFRWRPWLVLPARALPLPAELAVRRSFLAPTLFRIGGVREPTLLRFPPRYRGHEEELRLRLGAREVRDGRIVRGLRAAWTWLRGQIFGGDATESG
jgi:hypothetical protein